MIARIVRLLDQHEPPRSPEEQRTPAAPPAGPGTPAAPTPSSPAAPSPALPAELVSALEDERDRISAAIGDLAAAHALLESLPAPPAPSPARPRSSPAPPPPSPVPAAPFPPPPPMPVQEAAAGTDRAEIGARVRDLRTARGMTQRELAGERYSRALLAAVEAGTRSATADLLAYLAERLGIGQDELRFGRPPGAAEALRAQLEEARRRSWQGDHAQAMAMAAEAETRAERYRLPGLVCYARFCQGEALLRASDVSGALVVLRRAAESHDGGVLDDAGVLGARVRARIAACLFVSGRLGAAVAEAESALGALRATGASCPDAELWLLTALIHPSMELGALERAWRLVNEGAALLPHASDREAVANFLMQAAQVWEVRGEAREAERALTEALDIFGELGMRFEIAQCHWGRGYVLMPQGRLEEAREELVRSREIFDLAGSAHGYSGATVVLADVLTLQGRTDEAAAMCREAASLAQAVGYQETVATAHRLLAQITAQEGDAETAEELLADAVERCGRAGLNRELVVSCRVYGELLAGQGRLEEAVAVLRRGIAGITGSG
nr:tetratricopeptide repeat protein [Sphaerisporangium krabiense]